MVQRWDDGSETKQNLPNPELNPLLNPVLGRNLGRWAQAYFTSPPEKREEAVIELLRELQSEPPEQPPQFQSSPPQLEPQVVCAVCHHRSGAVQNFCGMCGSPLNPAAERLVHPAGLSQDEEKSSGKGYPAELMFSSEAPSAASEEPLGANQAGEQNLEFLRSKADIYVYPDASRPRLARFLVVFLALAVAGFAYWQWRLHSAESQNTHLAATPSSSSPSGPTATPSSPTGTRDTPVARRTYKTSENARNTSGQEPTASSARTASGLFSEPPLDQQQAADISPLQGGTSELAMAQSYLKGKNAAPDNEAAAKWLWKAVSKENPTAVLMLADLYVRGEGVPRNCDQARLLLVAAAKKGMPQAADKLRNLEANGCP